MAQSSPTEVPERATSQPELRRVMGAKLLLLFIVGDILGTGIYAVTGKCRQRGGGLEAGEPSIARISKPARHASERSASQCWNACFERPSTMANRRAGPVPARTPVRSMITVTYLSPRRVWRQTCSSMPMVVTPSKRCGSAIRTRLPSANTAALAVFHDTARALGDPGDGQVPDHDGLQRPPQATAGQLRARARPSWRCPGATRARSRCSDSDVLCENSHNRKTSTPTRRPTRRAWLHPHL